MKREIIHVCRLLVKRTKQLLPLFLITCAFIFIARDQISVSRSPLEALRPGRNVTSQTSSSALRVGVTVIQPTAEPLDKYANYSVHGERNAAKARDHCQKFQALSQDIPLTVRWSKTNSLLFCPIYKVGTTFWRRVFMIQREKRYEHLVNPYLLPFDKEYPAAKFVWKQNATVPQYKVMFTRDPYNRLFSFFVDKMLAPNPYFWKSVGVQVAVLTRHVVVKGKQSKVCGHDITFPEFIKYVIHTLETRKGIDPHWIEMETNCRPCEMQYDFIGQMEQFPEDSMQIIQKLDLTGMASFLKTKGKDASVDDAIRDTLSQPFTFLSKYRPCMTFKDALSRAWQKLKIRGLIGNTSLDGLVINEKTTKLGDVIARAYASRNASTELERSQMKSQFFKELWTGVNITDLHKLKKLYSKDFYLFGYNEMPSTLFNLKTDR